MYPIYMNGDLGKARYSTDTNLEVITRMYDNGKRSKSAVYAYLRSLGIKEELCEYAVNNYMTNQEPTKNKIYMTITLPSIVDTLTLLKQKLASIGSNEQTRINYSTDQAMKISESILSELFILNQNLSLLESTKSDERAHSEAVQRVKQATLRSKPEFFYANKIINSFRNFTDVVAVKECVEYFSKFINENKYTNAVATYIYEAFDKADSNFYEDSIKDAEFLLKHNEQYIKENASTVLSKHGWIPTISSIITECNNESKKMNSNASVIVEKVFSPIQVNEDGSYIFKLNNKLFKVAGKKVDEASVSELDYKMSKLMPLLNEGMYSVKDETIKFYKANDILEVVFENRNIKVNGISVDKTNINGLRSALQASNYFRIDEMYVVEDFLYLFENVSTIKELDNVVRLKGINGSVINMIKLDDTNVYINRINPNTGVNEMFKALDSEHAQTLVNEYFTFDISTQVYEMLSLSDKNKTRLVAEKNEILSNIKFLESEIEKVNSAYRQTAAPVLLEAKELLEDELRKFNVDIQKLYEQLDVYNF